MINILQTTDRLYVAVNSKKQALFKSKNALITGTTTDLVETVQQLEKKWLWDKSAKNIASHLLQLTQSQSGDMLVCTKDNQVVADVGQQEIIALDKHKAKSYILAKGSLLSLLTRAYKLGHPQIGCITKDNTRVLYPEQVHIDVPPEEYQDSLLSKRVAHNNELYDALHNAVGEKNKKQLDYILKHLNQTDYGILDTLEWKAMSKWHHIRPRSKKPLPLRKRKELFSKFVEENKTSQDIVLQITEHQRIYDLTDRLENALRLPVRALERTGYVIITAGPKQAPIINKALQRRDRSILRNDTLQRTVKNARLAATIFYPELLSINDFADGLRSFAAAAQRIRVRDVPYHLRNVQVLEAQDITCGEGVKVAVLDTGVDYNHPELAHLFDKENRGYNFVNESDDPFDDEGHGTHVTGLHAGISCGIATGADVYAVKVLNEWGYGSETDFIRAIEWSIINHMDIISMSLGSTQSSLLEQEAVKAAADNDIVIFAAAGNEERGPSYPAAYMGVISVAAVDEHNHHAWFSNIHSTIDVAAPGVQVISSIPGGGYAAYDGTSMSTPIASGVGSLVVSLTDVHECEDIIKDSALQIGQGESQQQEKYGTGLVQAYDAVRNAHVCQ